MGGRNKYGGLKTIQKLTIGGGIIRYFRADLSKLERMYQMTISFNIVATNK